MVTDGNAGLEAGLAALELLLDSDRVSITEVVGALGISRSAAHRLMSTLQGRGYAALGAGGRGYSAGPALLGFSRIPAIEPEARFRLRPVLQQLREITGESVHSAVLVADQVLVVDGRRSAFRNDIGLRIGMTAPANTMAAGKLLLASMPNEAVVALLPVTRLVRRAPASIVTPERLLAALDEVRQSGWSRAIQESEPGVNSIAVPLDGAGWRTRVALVVSTPLERGAPRRLAELARLALDVVADFAARGVVHPWRLRLSRRR